MIPFQHEQAASTFVRIHEKMEFKSTTPSVSTYLPKELVQNSGENRVLESDPGNLVSNGKVGQHGPETKRHKEICITEE